MTENERTIKAELLKKVCSESAEGNFAPFVKTDEDGRECGIIASILAEVIAEHEPHYILRNLIEDKDTFLHYKHGVYSVLNKPSIKAMIREYLPEKSVTDNLLNNTHNLLFATTDESRIRKASESDSDPRYLNFRNGLLDVETKKLLPHSPNVFSVFQYDFDYDESETKHEVFDKYIRDLCSKPDGSIDEDEIKIIQEYLGFVLSNEHMSKIKAAMVLWSRQGNSGKSVLIRLITAMLGTDRIASIKLKELTVDNRFILGTLPECRVIACGDESNSSITDSSIFKALTGGDPVKIEPKGKQPYPYIFKGGFIIACNGLPAFTDDKGDHLFDRLLIIPCEHHITDEIKDPNLDEKLYQERQAIFNWALQGFYRLRQNNYVFSRSASSSLSKTEYRKAMDNVFRFISERYTITHIYDDRISKTDFDQSYARWAAADISIKAVEPKNLAARMEALGVSVSFGNIGNRHHIAVYRGIKENLEGFQELPQEMIDQLPWKEDGFLPPGG